MKQSQLLKGVLEGCVLQMIAKEAIYGYELIQRLRQAGFTDIVGGTVYPLLQKLEKNHLIYAQKRPSSDGPDRRYFFVTSEGKEALDHFWQQWHDLLETVAVVEKMKGFDNDNSNKT
ncbi:PadR family transcriptional regulator [Streptococcus phocae subsp. salmonis]|uniref:PadR family transcriptional regulator n=1 Tax=Streptococcus phocae TaxID=119224 RepID=A0A0P6SDR4_9STRE|nr:PadR family transcriptional regulator [Streptococcus phocae]KGR73028.1 PadR family transcriptional regulator [Streptococcus phocae subsp. salmonis]KPJ22245.1 PadR family transcriptional regulator [Streptococcus phocae]